MSPDSKMPVYECSFNPIDPTVTCCSGKGVLKFFRFADNTFQAMPTITGQRLEQETFTCHAWLPEDKVIILGTDHGNLHLLESDGASRVLPNSPGNGVSISCVISYSKGFICGGDGARVWVCDRVEEENDFR